MGINYTKVDDTKNFISGVNTSGGGDSINSSGITNTSSFKNNATTNNNTFYHNQLNTLNTKFDKSIECLEKIIDLVNNVNDSFMNSSGNDISDIHNDLESIIIEFKKIKAKVEEYKTSRNQKATSYTNQYLKYCNIRNNNEEYKRSKVGAWTYYSYINQVDINKTNGNISLEIISKKYDHIDGSPLNWISTPKIATAYWESIDPGIFDHSGDGGKF